MTQIHNQSPLDKHREKAEPLIKSLLSRATPLVDIATEVNRETGVRTSERSIRRAIERWNIEGPPSEANFERPGLKLENDRAELTSTPSDQLASPEDLMIERGLNPEDWEVKSMTINEWEGAPVKTDQSNGKVVNRLYRQLKINLVKKLKLSFPTPAESSDFRRAKIVAPKNVNGQLTVFTGDQQAPFHDRDLHERFLGWLKNNRPAKGVLIGDTVDFPDISRHRWNPEGTATVQECINAGYGIVRDYVEASPDTEWIALAGNHDERIRNTLLDQAARLYGVKRAEIEDTEEASVLSVAHLLRFDELGVHFVEPEGSYDQCQVNISPYLAARHGWLASKGSGSSALKTLEHLGYSVVVGHTHRQSLVHKTTHDIEGQPTTVAGVETGCMCRIEEGLGYAVAPDWQNGFATAHLWPDGKFKIDLATYVSDVLMWRDQRY